MLELRVCASLPYRDKAFDSSKTAIVYCASGGRSALALGLMLADCAPRHS